MSPDRVKLAFTLYVVGTAVRDNLFQKVGGKFAEAFNSGCAGLTNTTERLGKNSQYVQFFHPRSV